MENKPSLLYRGLKINYNNLSNYEFTGVDLIVNYAPIIDQYGRKTVLDGNEYGVYMSDNLNMVAAAYGDLHHDGIPVINNLLINNERVLIPSVAVIYEINTEGLDIRRPFISEQLRGHYNNGYQGEEWIADVVPASNYTLYRVRIGADILHEAEDIDLTRVKNVSEYVKQELDMRKYRLETFANAIFSMAPMKRSAIGKTELNLLKMFYGKNGLKYVNENGIDTSTLDGMLRYLMAKTFKKDESNIDFQAINYIIGLKDRITDIDSIIEVLESDKLKNEQEKVLFVNRKKQEGVRYLTSKFDKQEKRIDDFIAIIKLRLDSDKQKEQKQSSFKEDEQDLEWEMIKEKYHYDELEEELQEALEEQYKMMVNRRKMRAIDSDDVIDTYENDNITRRTKL